MAKHFSWYDDWRDALLECPNCSWTGKFNEGWEDDFADVMESRCPSCEKNPIVAIVAFPMLAEMKANRDKLSDAEKRLVSSMENCPDKK